MCTHTHTHAYTLPHGHMQSHPNTCTTKQQDFTGDTVWRHPHTHTHSLCLTDGTCQDAKTQPWGPASLKWLSARRESSEWANERLSDFSFMLLSGKFLPAMNWILTENTAQTTALSSEKKCFRRRITQRHHFNKLFAKPGVFSVETTLWLCILLFFYIIQLELKTFADVYFSGPLVLLDEPFSPHPLCLHRALVKPLCQSKQLQVLAH